MKDISNATVKNSLFQNLKGANSNGGGAIIIENTNDAIIAPTVVVNCEIRESSSKISGGGIGLINVRDVRLEQSKFINNYALHKGGALFHNCNATGTQSYECNLAIFNCLFKDNFAG